MRNNNFIDFGEEISRTVRKVLNSQDLYDLKNTINRTMNNVPGMGGSPFFQDPFKGAGIPPLSKEYRNDNDAGNYGSFATQNYRTNHKVTKGTGSLASILFLVFGFIGAITTGLVTLIGIATEATIGNIPALTVISTIFGVLFFVFLPMIIVGYKLRNRIKRFKRYQKLLNGRTYCMIQELSTATGEESKFIISDLRKMIKSGLFAEAYLDEQETCLMTDYKTYTQYLETMKNAKERQEAEKKEKEKWANRQDGNILKETIDEGKNYIQIIKAANDALPEVEISEKLDQLENVTTKIFDYVEQHPDKLPEIRKFMCYYMPITLKLVKAYQNFDEHGFNETEIVDTKLEIKGTLDTINMAYQNLLKKLMQTDILDVSSDISALETILAQEGLTDDDFITNKGLN
ncbi:5-bromo-4-chloroindolyl phosphate hydrolysis family protein [Aminipila sp.]|uniref:5-bromo-4-chloroindolyl phosphate hydrolysis family protein n=1 Tax=Aminipila sp. TaxID=2060095 RepID=UPI00289C2D70|nr:5-bromo-4-chloroindolyl phosphate hydrolysis family protein [Aminipila sp.]